MFSTDIARYEEKDHTVKLISEKHDDHVQSVIEKITFDNCTKISSLEAESEIINLLLQHANNLGSFNTLEELKLEAEQAIYKATGRFIANTIITGNKELVNSLDKYYYRVICYSEVLSKNTFLFLFNGADLLTNSAVIIKKDGEYGINFTDYLIIEGKVK